MAAKMAAIEKSELHNFANKVTKNHVIPHFFTNLLGENILRFKVKSFLRLNMTWKCNKKKDNIVIFTLCNPD